MSIRSVGILYIIISAITLIKSNSALILHSYVIGMFYAYVVSEV